MNTITRIAAIRHGETAWNADSRLQGQLDIGLNAKGRAQAARLADALRDEGLSAVIASDLGRAADTARALCDALGLPLLTDPGLRERGFGQMEGMTYQEIDAHQPDWAARWRSRDPDFAPPGGESLNVFRQRCVTAAAAIARRHAGASIAIVTHGGVLDCLYRAAAGVELGAPRTWHLGNAAINRLLHTGEAFTLVGWNDGQHLEAGFLEEER